MESNDKTSRSIFVGNIPYEATEEKLMSLFGQAGPVINFRLVYDRESGKPKGYGFCEYNSAEIAHSALRNLNNIDFNGRPLRIGPAAGEQNSAEVAMNNNTSMKPPQESPYGEKCEPAECPSIISNAVASFSPEYLYQLNQEMKEFITNNPIEARQYLIQNPQFAYLLLQTQIRMGTIDHKKAVSMLTHVHPKDQQPQELFTINGTNNSSSNSSNHLMNQNHHHAPISQSQPVISAAPSIIPPSSHHQHQMFMPSNHLNSNQHYQELPLPSVSTASSSTTPSNQLPLPQLPPLIPPQQQQQQQHQQQQQQQQPMQSQHHHAQSNFHHYNNIPVSSHNSYRPIKTEPSELNSTQKQEALDMMQLFDNNGEKEKAALIMQVLSLTDEQVAMLPEDQRNSIEVLKNQLKKS